MGNICNFAESMVKLGGDNLTCEGLENMRCWMSYGHTNLHH